MNFVTGIIHVNKREEIIKSEVFIQLFHLPIYLPVLRRWTYIKTHYWLLYTMLLTRAKFFALFGATLLFS